MYILNNTHHIHMPLLYYISFNWIHTHLQSVWLAPYIKINVILVNLL